MNKCCHTAVNQTYCLALCSFGQPSRALVVITWRGVGCRCMMRLGQTIKRAQLLNIKAQMSSIWDEQCMLMISVCVTPPWWRRKSWYIIITLDNKYKTLVMIIWSQVSPYVIKNISVNLCHEFVKVVNFFINQIFVIVMHI